MHSRIHALNAMFLVDPIEWNDADGYLYNRHMETWASMQRHCGSVVLIGRVLSRCIDSHSIETSVTFWSLEILAGNIGSFKRRRRILLGAQQEMGA